MAKRYDAPPVGAAASGAPPEAIRMEFARRLQAALNEKGWTQSELARRVAPLLKHSRIGRDNISKYVRGKVLPLPPALEAIAKVLDRKNTDLLPVRSTAASNEHPPVSIRDMGDNEMAWLQINMALPWDKVLEIQQIIRRKDGGRG
jgi:transcriptional regulator with XRE-family HTH domain